jgi:two-component system sensor kinase FixL
VQALLLGALFFQVWARRRAERVQRGERSLRSAIIDALPERVAILDRRGRITATNRTWREFARSRRAAGVDVGDDYAAAVRRAIDSGREDARRTSAGLAAILGGSRTLERLEYRREDGGVESAVELTLSPLEDGEGAVVAVADVTDRHEGEEGLRAVLESLPIAVLIVGDDGAIARVNAEAERLFGYCREELVGRPIRLLVPDRNGRGLAVDRAGSREGPPPAAACELTGRRRDGSELPIAVHLRSIRSRGRLELLVAIGDLSLRRQLERDAQRLRVEATHFGRLASAGELSAAIVHELNQPLTGILTNSQAALQLVASGAARPEDLSETLADIAADGRRAGEVIQRLRTLLRKGPIDLRPIDLNEPVLQVAQLVGQDLLLRGSTLDLELASELPRIRGDRVHLQQVALNLILNGIDAMASLPSGERRLLVRTAPASGRMVELEVRDAGPGIGREAFAHLFEPFYTTKPDGMGMGLAIVRSIVESHGGRVSAVNSPSGGASFVVSLPTAAGADAA